jgi:hypothetical protein
LGHLGQTEGNYIWRGSDYCFFEWCPGASYVEFRLSLDKSDLYNQIIAYPSQLYMALVPGEYVQDTIPSSGNFAATASLIALVGFLLIMTSESERFVILGATGFILYSTLVMVAGHVYLPRYTIPISPFHSILSGVAIAIFFQIFAAVRLEGLGHLRRTHPRAFQTAGYCVVTAAIIGSVYLIARAQTPPELYATGPVIDAEEYLAQQIPDAVVYNPQSDNLRWRDTSIFLDESTLSDDDLENLGRWKSTLLPGYLKVVGIDYVAVDQIWFWYRADDDGDPALLENENYYELEQTFSEMFGWGTDQIHLYRVIGQETEATGN